MLGGRVVAAVAAAMSGDADRRLGGMVTRRHGDSPIDTLALCCFPSPPALPAPQTLEYMAPEGERRGLRA